MKTLTTLLVLMSFLVSAQIPHIEDDYVEQRIKANPGMLEAYLHHQNLVVDNEEVLIDKNEVIRIPVNVHLIESKNRTIRCRMKDVTDSNIIGQIDLLNRCMRGEMLNLSIITPQSANMQIEFYLDSVIRVTTPKSSFSMSEENAKFSSLGGSDNITPETHLNIWVCELELLDGYSTLPGDTSAVDGIVIDVWHFGSNGPTEGMELAQKVNHWLGLIHVDYFNAYTEDQKKKVLIAFNKYREAMWNEKKG